jgi:hypothetical protein
MRGEYDRAARSLPPYRKGIEVATVVVTHAVEDVERWLGGKAVRVAAFGSVGGSSVTDYVAADGSNNIAVTADAPDVEAVKAMVASPPADILEGMQAHGVVPPITVYVQA